MTGSKFAEILPEPGQVRTLAEGFATAEGPVWTPKDRRLVFSEVGFIITPQGMAKGNSGRRHSFDPATGKVSLLADPANMGNGLALDSAGRLVICELETHRVVRLEADGAVTVLAAQCDGEDLKSPNDVAIASDGGVYFTDTGGGSVYHVSPDATAVRRVARDYKTANGLALSVDGRRLYVNDSKGHRADPDFWMSRGSILVYDVLADGGLANGRVFAVLDGEGSGTADGMKVDAEDNVYCSGPRGIWVFNPGGEHLGVIETGVVHNKNNVTNLTWGGEDGRTLFITTTTSLLQVRTGIPGAL